MRRGQVDVYIVLEDLLKEALSLSQFDLLCHLHVGEPLAVLGIRWQTEQQKPGVKCCSKAAELLIRVAFHQKDSTNSTDWFLHSGVGWVRCSRDFNVNHKREAPSTHPRPLTRSFCMYASKGGPTEIQSLQSCLDPLWMRGFVLSDLWACWSV